LELSPTLSPYIVQPLLAMSRSPLVLVREFSAGEPERLAAFADLVRHQGHFLAAQIAPADSVPLGNALRALGGDRLFFALPATGDFGHSVGAYRALAEALR